MATRFPTVVIPRRKRYVFLLSRGVTSLSFAHVRIVLNRAFIAIFLRISPRIHRLQGFLSEFWLRAFVIFSALICSSNTTVLFAFFTFSFFAVKRFVYIFVFLFDDVNSEVAQLGINRIHEAPFLTSLAANKSCSYLQYKFIDMKWR